MKHIISSLLYLVILLCLSVFVFDPTNLYYEIWWLDIPMHIMGGFGVAALILSVVNYRRKTISYFYLIMLFLCVDVALEVYEVAVETMKSVPWNGWGDTIKDIIDGILGSSLAYYLLQK